MCARSRCLQDYLSAAFVKAFSTMHRKIQLKRFLCLYNTCWSLKRIVEVELMSKL